VARKHRVVAPRQVEEAKVPKAKKKSKKKSKKKGSAWDGAELVAIEYNFSPTVVGFYNSLDSLDLRRFYRFFGRMLHAMLSSRAGVRTRLTAIRTVL